MSDLLTQTPRLIRVHGDDNVAIVVNDGGLARGAQVQPGLVLREAVPQGHKVALHDIAEGGAIVRYGEIIGYALRPLPAGSWIEESAVRLPAAPALNELPLATAVPKAQPKLEGHTFEGYRNADGSAGTRNVLGISTSVQCVAGVVDHAVARIRRELLPRFANVDGVVSLEHIYGCGVAINAPAAVVPIRTLQNIARNPNFGGEVMVVGLGCEKLLPERLLPPGVEPGGATPIVRLQEQHGFGPMIAAIMAAAEQHLEKLNARTREPIPASELVVGMQCGGSDAFSGVTANPALGYAADLLVRAGASVMFSEVTEVRDAIHLLTPRAIDEEVGRGLLREMDWYDTYLAAGKTDRSANPTPGNKRGGLANIVEKALGSIAKSGTSPIVDVLSPGERIRRRGLTFAATPASDFVCGTLQMASGMNLEVFTTGRGTPYALEAVPVIKVATHTSLAEQWPDLIDFNAGRIATGEMTIEQAGWDLFRLMLAIASGRATWTEQHGIHNSLALFNPAPIT